MILVQPDENLANLTILDVDFRHQLQALGPAGQGIVASMIKFGQR